MAKRPKRLPADDVNLTAKRILDIATRDDVGAKRSPAAVKKLQPAKPRKR